jgi:hypothetical protein
MADKVVLEAEIKSNIKGVTKDQKEWNKEIQKTEENIKDVNKEGKEVIAEMQILGISINGLKAGWDTAAKGARFMFRTIKAGIISTGIGALVVAFGALATWFTKTKRGAEVLQVAFAGVGAAVRVIIDRISTFGGGIAKILSGEVRAGLKDMANSFRNIGDEIKTDTLLTMVLTKETQKLSDSQRALNVETAQRRADIEELKLIAEDVTKSEEERLTAAQKAFDIENDLLTRRIANAEEAVRLERMRQKNILDPQKEDLDNLAQLEIDLANIRGESTTKQIELNNKINSIKQETINKNIQLQQQNEAEKKAAEDLIKELQLLRIKDDHNRQILENEQQRRDRKASQEKLLNRKLTAEEIAIIDEIYNQKYLNLVEKAKTVTIDGNEAVVESAEDTTQAQLSAAAHLTGALSNLAGENKLLSAASATISTYAAATGALETGKGTPAAWANAAAIIINGLANVRKIFAVNIPGSSGGGGGAGPEPPAPQMMSGAFELTGGIAPEPLRAYVVTDEMTNSQNQLANIRRRATI